MVDMQCEFCRTVGYYSGYKNTKCKKEIESGRCALCIKAISTDDVKEEIDKLMKEDKE